MIRKPLEIKRLGTNGVAVSWDDGTLQEIPSLRLRENCPCATCREKRGQGNHEKPLTTKKSLLKIVESSTAEETSLQQIWPVGQYALGMRWGDGHDTGIFTFSICLNLGRKSLFFPLA